MFIKGTLFEVLASNWDADKSYLGKQQERDLSSISFHGVTS